MKVNFYLDKPYNPDIAPEKVKQELAKIGGKKKNLAQKFVILPILWAKSSVF